MIAREILCVIAEAYSDEFMSHVSDESPKNIKRWKTLVEKAKKTFPHTKQLNWFLRHVADHCKIYNPRIDYWEEVFTRFEHYFSLPMDAIQNFSFRSLSIDDASGRLRELEKRWQESAKRLIPKEYAYGVEYSGEEPEDIVTFPDGFRWTNLHTAYSSREAEAMGHCGNEPRKDSKDTILSLRQLVKQGDKEYLMPHATFVLAQDGYLRELKGFQNHKLAPKYMRYVVELFKRYRDIYGIDNEESYRPESDVTWDDFTREQLQDILRSNPNITDGEVRYKATGADGTYTLRYGKMIVSNGGETIRKESDSGTIEYYNKDGKRHRDDGPAVIYSYGQEEWWRNGRIHRDDGPAIKHRGYEEWWRNGRIHRDDGPAIRRPDGGKDWYRDGKLHRDDGPAKIYPNGIHVTWWRNGNMYYPKESVIKDYWDRRRSGEITE